MYCNYPSGSHIAEYNTYIPHSYGDNLDASLGYITERFLLNSVKKLKPCLFLTTEVVSIRRQRNNNTI